MTMKTKGPDEAATSVQAGVQSTSPSKDQKMNSHLNNISAGVSPSLHTRLGDVSDILASARYLTEAVFMAAHGLMLNDATNAFQALASEIEDKLLNARDRLDELRDELRPSELGILDEIMMLEKRLNERRKALEGTA